jgi:hypothetical protein
LKWHNCYMLLQKLPKKHVKHHGVSATCDGGCGRSWFAWDCLLRRQH